MVGWVVLGKLVSEGGDPSFAESVASVSQGMGVGLGRGEGAGKIGEGASEELDVEGVAKVMDEGGFRWELFEVPAEILPAGSST